MKFKICIYQQPLPKRYNMPLQTTAPESEILASGYVTVDENWIITTVIKKLQSFLAGISRNIIGKHCRDIFSTISASDHLLSYHPQTPGKAVATLN